MTCKFVIGVRSECKSWGHLNSIPPHLHFSAQELLCRNQVFPKLTQVCHSRDHTVWLELPPMLASYPRAEPAPAKYPPEPPPTRPCIWSSLSCPCLPEGCLALPGICHTESWSAIMFFVRWVLSPHLKWTALTALATHKNSLSPHHHSSVSSRIPFPN